MPHSLVPPSDRELARRAGARAILRHEAKRQRARAVPVNTERAYASDWRQFERWCHTMGCQALPADEETLCNYLTHLSLDRRVRRRKKGSLAGQNVEGFSFQATSIERKLTAIVQRHRTRGHLSPRTPVVTEQMRAIWRDRESVPKGSAPLLGTHVLAMSACMQEAIEAGGARAEIAIRDRAALLIGWHCAMRRSEVAGLKLNSIEFLPEGMTVHIGRSKTDQQGRGRTLWLTRVKKHPAACPIAALERWLKLRGEDKGALFWYARRSEISSGEPMPAWQMVTIIDRWVRIAKIEPESKGTEFTPHSLRAGFITHAIRQDRPVKETMEHSGHLSVETFMDYVRTATGFSRTVQSGILEDL